MHTARLFSTVIITLIFMGCPPPVSDNSAQSSDNPNASASGGDNLAQGDPEPKAIVVSQVSAGESYTMILKSDDSLWAFGDNQYGQLGNGKSGDDVVELNPVQVMTAEGRPMTEVDQVSAGTSHTMIVKKGGTLWAVGRNNKGQLGDGSLVDKKNPVQVLTSPEGPAITEVAQVSAGNTHTMILKATGDLWAVGNNAQGQLGNDDSMLRDKLNPVQIMTAAGEPMAEVDQVSAGGFHSMILKKNSNLWGTGFNFAGQLGDGTSRNRKQKPVQVMEKPLGADPARAMTEIDQVSTGVSYTIILKKNGTLWGTGHNEYGQLGDNTQDNRANPVQVLTAPLPEGRAMTEVDQVSAGYNHSMILKENGSLWAVGKNDHGQLGDGSTTNKKTPVQVMIAEDRPMTEVAQVSAGDTHTIIVKRDGSLWAVGRNHKGQLGNGDVNRANKLFPVEITVP